MIVEGTANVPADPGCKECGRPFPRTELLEGICTECIFGLASKQTSVTREKIRETARAVERETSGLIPPEALRALIEGAIERAQAGEQTDLVVEFVAMKIQCLAGLRMCGEMQKMAEGFREMSARVKDGLEEAAVGIEEEVRRKVRVLTNLGRGDSE